MNRLARSLSSMIVLIMLMTFSHAHAATEDQTHGRKVLFMGHSFFRDTVQYVPLHADNYRLVNHEQTLVFKGGERGSPGSLWASTDANVEQAKMDLQNGVYDTLAMTYYPTNSRASDFARWFDLAIAGNPDISFYIYMPWSTYYGQSRSVYATSSAIQRPVVISVFREVRERYPANRMYLVPMGDLMPKLWELQAEGQLDEITKIMADEPRRDYGNPDFLTSLFMDPIGHAGEIASRNGAMFWLASLYNVDLTAYDYDTETETDLRPVVQQFMIDEPLTSYHDPEAPTGIPFPLTVFGNGFE